MKFSIITCSFNCLDGLKAARAQVLAQQGVEIEHLIIDGGSTDGTKEWLEIDHRTSNIEHLEFIWISEPDKGLYDALNKGLRLATGDVIGVLHTDDLWEHDLVLARVAEKFSEFDAVYGDLYYVDATDTSRIRRVWRSGAYHPRKWSHGWMPPHTALFVRREAALRVGEYLTDHGSAADYEWMLRAGLVHHLKMVHLPEVLLRMRVGGASNASVSRRLNAHRHDRLAWTRNGLTPKPWTLKMKLLRKLPQWLHARFLRSPHPGEAARTTAQGVSP